MSCALGSLKHDELSPLPTQRLQTASAQGRGASTPVFPNLIVPVVARVYSSTSESPSTSNTLDRGISALGTISRLILCIVSQVLLLTQARLPGAGRRSASETSGLSAVRT